MIKKLKYYLISGLFCGAVLIADPIQAGTLNSNESSVLGVLQSGFEADGQSYKVAPEYIGQAREYFMQDDVDLTSDQRSEAISNIYGNIQQGVDEGYLIPTGGSSTADSKKSEDANSGANSDSKVDNKSDAKSEANIEDMLTGKKSESAAKATTEKPTEKSTSSEVKVNKEKAKVQVVSAKGEVLLSTQTIIKDTGYPLNQTAALIGFFLLLFIACCLLIHRNHLLTTDKELSHEE